MLIRRNYSDIYLFALLLKLQAIQFCPSPAVHIEELESDRRGLQTGKSKDEAQLMN